MEKSLAEIAAQYNTDKAIHTHYLSGYEQCFGKLRNANIKLLELGVKAGGSLLLWRDYFAHGLIVGLDIEPVNLPESSDSIHVYQGGQQDTALLDRIALENAPEGFDIIIDDCAHIGVLARVSFWHLFDNHLKSGGIYVIEDWGTGYWDEWVDGVKLTPQRKEFSPALYQLTRVVARLRQSGFGRLPLLKNIISWGKSLTLKPQYQSHDYGMVGFVKELVDEMGMSDITHPQFGSAAPRESKFAEMRFGLGHIFITKK